MKRSKLTPYLLLAPGLLWLIVFFVIPLYYSGKLSLYGGASLEQGFRFDWDWSNFSDSLSLYDTQFVRSLIYAGIATILCLLIGYPVAYAIAFKAGKWRNLFLFAVDRALLHHLPDPDPRLGDDPLRREPGGERPADAPHRPRRRAAFWQRLRR